MATPMERAVHGEWNGFVFRGATVEDFPVISKLLRENFYPYEPFTLLLGTSEEYEKNVDDMFKRMLEDGLSFIVFDKATNNVAGVRLNFHNAKGNSPSPSPSMAPQTQKILYLLGLLNEKSQLWEAHNITELLNLFMTCVHADYRGRGIVTEIYRRTIALGREAGYFLTMATFTSPFSRAGAAKAGFKEVARIPLKDLKDDKGEIVVPGATEDNFITQAIYIN